MIRIGPYNPVLSKIPAQSFGADFAHCRSGTLRRWLVWGTLGQSRAARVPTLFPSVPPPPNTHMKKIPAYREANMSAADLPTIKDPKKERN